MAGVLSFRITLTVPMSTRGRRLIVRTGDSGTQVPAVDVPDPRTNAVSAKLSLMFIQMNHF